MTNCLENVLELEHVLILEQHILALELLDKLAFYSK